MWYAASLPSRVRIALRGLLLALGGGGRRQCRRQGLMAIRRDDVACDVLLRSANLELIEQEAKLLLLVGDDLVLGRQLPQLALERTERLLARLVDELDVVVRGLALVERVAEAPRLDFVQEIGRERRMVVERVLEARGEVDLGRLDPREAVEELVGQGRRAVLDGAGEAV
jgi:hypothetical protein